MFAIAIVAGIWAWTFIAILVMAVTAPELDPSDPSGYSDTELADAALRRGELRWLA